jgi:hypothetical protein
VKLGTFRGTPDGRVPGTIRFVLKLRTFGMVVVQCEGTLPCLGLPCKIINQSIVGLSPLSETT